MVQGLQPDSASQNKERGSAQAYTYLDLSAYSQELLLECLA